MSGPGWFLLEALGDNLFPFPFPNPRGYLPPLAHRPACSHLHSLSVISLFPSDSNSSCVPPIKTFGITYYSTPIIQDTPPPFKSLTLTTSVKSFLLCRVTFTGSRDQDMNILGGHYSPDHRSYEHLRAMKKDEIIFGKVDN